MSIRNLDYLIKPKSIALLGASKKDGSVGQVLAKNLFNAGFEGDIWLVNPKHQEIEGVKAYPDVASLPGTPDLAVISTPPDSVPGIVSELGEHGTKAAVVITAGFGEGTDEHGKELLQQMLNAAKPHLLRIVGPNCVGIMVPGSGINASFAHLTPKKGKLAFITQSGAIVTAVLDWANSRGIGFSHLVSLGGMSDVDFGDLLDYLANDPETGAILMYVEAISEARKFMSAARAASRMKPVIVVKSGRFEEGAKAAASHTGALAGADAVYDVAFHRAGMLRVTTLDEVFDAVETLALANSPKGDRLVIVTNGGGMGVMATDALIHHGGKLAELDESTIEALNKVLPPTWSHGNPVDIIGDAPGQRYADTLKILADADGIDGILVLNCPTAVASPIDAAEAVVQNFAEHRKFTILTSWVGDGAAKSSRQMFAKHGIASYETPEQAVRAFMYLVQYQRSQKMLMETPPSIPEEFQPDPTKAREIIQKALDEGRDILTEPEAKEVLTAYKIPTVSTKVVATPEEAAEVAAEIGSSVALKILSHDISHKSDVGGVVLDLNGPADVKNSAIKMLEKVSEKFPNADIQGFTVQPMIKRPGAYELILGVMLDIQFGPVLLVGHGGTGVEIIKDQALGLPPLNMHLAEEMLSRTRIHGLLKGFRGFPAANLDAIKLTMIKISQMVIDLAEIEELDINPLLVDEYGVMALDARIKVSKSDKSGPQRLAIRPYPQELEETIRIDDGQTFLLRPVVPEDEPALHRAFERFTPEQIKLRFFAPIKALSHVQAARFTQIDYDREMSLVITQPGIPGGTEIIGTVYITADPDNTRAEYAIIVQDEMTRKGLGAILMDRIIQYARERGIGEIFGDVLRENKPMLELCDQLGFQHYRVEDEPNVVRVELKL